MSFDDFKLQVNEIVKGLNDYSLIINTFVDVIKEWFTLLYFLYII